MNAFICENLVEMVFGVMAFSMFESIAGHHGDILGIMLVASWLAAL